MFESQVKCLLHIMKSSLWQKVKMVTFDKQISCPNLLKGLTFNIKTSKNLKNFESILVIL